MKPRIKLGSATSPDGTLIELIEHDGNHEILAGGRELMATRMHHSEEELARLACVDLPERPVVLIGGLGMGYTLRTTLDLLPEDGRVLQVEMVPEVVEWNRGPLAHHAGHPLEDPRVELVMSDVVPAIKTHREDLAAIMLDVDNGPTPLVDGSNLSLYSNAGLKALRNALIPGGHLAIWSAGEESHFPSRLEHFGFEAQEHVTHARPKRKGPRHFVYVGRKPR